MNEIEIRSFSSEIEKVGERTVIGYALLFDVESKVLRSETGENFNEMIDRSAIDESIIENSDVFCWLNHNKNRGLLARSKNGKGSLKLTIDERGLKYEFESPNSEIGNELIENLKRGDVTESSFAFSVAKDIVIRRGGDALPLRKIMRFGRLADVSPVYTPAYEGTVVNCRSLDEFIETEKREQKEQELEEYFKKLNERL